MSCLSAAMLLAVASASAAPEASTHPSGEAIKAEVVSVTGAAQKLSAAGEAKWEPLKAGDTLGELTVIRTGLGAKVVLKFQDRGELTVNAATKVGICELRSEFLSKKQGFEFRANVGLKYGTISASVDGAKGENDFKVTTAVATLSVRGSGAQVGFMADTGMGVMPLAGHWAVNNGVGGRTAGPGEPTNSDLTPPWIVLQNLRYLCPMDPFGFRGGEDWLLRDWGSGRGILWFGTSGLLWDPVSPIHSIIDGGGGVG